VSESPDGFADTLFLIRNFNITALLGRIYLVLMLSAIDGAGEEAT